MTVAEAIRTDLRKLRKGRLFTASRFLKYGSRATVGRTLSRLVEQGEIRRLAHGVFVRPKISRFVGEVLPPVTEVVKVIAKNNHETIQRHGAEAAWLFKISTQVPLIHVYHTSASSRKLYIGNLTVKMIHTSNWRLLQFAGEKTGLALSALWYVGKNNVDHEVVSRIRSGLTEEEFNKLRSANIPIWMAKALNEFAVGATHG